MISSAILLRLMGGTSAVRLCQETYEYAVPRQAVLLTSGQYPITIQSNSWIEVIALAMSDYYKQLRQEIGTQLIFSPSVAAIIRNEKGEILFQRPSLSSDIWSLPAGAIELGETPADAVRREVYEETGLYVQPHKLLGVFGGKDFRFTYPDGNEVEYLALVFECIVEGGKLEAVDGESADLRYFPPSSLPKTAVLYPSEIFSPSSQQTLFQN